MGRYLDIIRSHEMDLNEQLKTESRKSDSQYERNERNELIAEQRELSPDELSHLDIRFRIVAPDDADTWSVEDWIEWIAERAAILEFDAKSSREQADSEACLLWRLYRRADAEGKEPVEHEET